MIKAVLCTLLVIFTSLGFFSAVYLIMLFFLRKNNRFGSCICVIPLTGVYKRDLHTIMYAYERINLFGEDVRCKIIAAGGEDNCEEMAELKNMFAMCRCVSIVYYDEIEGYAKGC